MFYLMTILKYIHRGGKRIENKNEWTSCVDVDVNGSVSWVSLVFVGS